MWSRQEIKENAKNRLRRAYWTPFFISLVLAIAVGGLSGSRYSANRGDIPVDGLFLIPIILGGLTMAIIGIALSVFIFGPLEAGCRKAYIEYLEGNENLNEVISSFKSPHYMNIVKAMLLTRIMIFLWMLLLIVPGIIKMYQYRFVPYILAENPSLNGYEAMEISTQLTNGHKTDMFVMDLSFIGWYLLGALALGVGVLFVNPYKDTSFTMLYYKLQEKSYEA